MSKDNQDENQLRPKPKGPLSGKRILICGKGGSGKSSIVALMARALREKDYEVLALDGDASNPGGLGRLLFSLGKAPRSLIEFFGGRERVECPVDNPQPLTRKDDGDPIPERNIDLSEIPPDYFHQEQGIVLVQTGKIQEACEGCHGPMSKITRDFIVTGEQVTLIDVEAGIEHFGRGVEKNIDIVLTIIDPTFESFSIAEKVKGLCSELGVKSVWSILNRAQSQEMESVMVEEMQKRDIETLGIIYHDTAIMNAGLKGTAVGRCQALKDTEMILEKLERKVSGVIA